MTPASLTYSLARLLEAIGAIREFSTVQGIINPRALDAGKVAAKRLQDFWQMSLDQLQ
jgi:hypothetical protein